MQKFPLRLKTQNVLRIWARSISLRRTWIQVPATTTMLTNNCSPRAPQSVSVAQLALTFGKTSQRRTNQDLVSTLKTPICLESPWKEQQIWVPNSSQRRTRTQGLASTQWEHLQRKLLYLLVRQNAKTSGRNRRRETHQVPEITRKTHLPLVKQKEVLQIWAQSSSPSKIWIQVRGITSVP